MKTKERINFYRQKAKEFYTELGVKESLVYVR